MNRFIGWSFAGAGVWMLWSAYKGVPPLQAFQALLGGTPPTGKKQ